VAAPFTHFPVYFPLVILSHDNISLTHWQRRKINRQ